MTQGVNIGRAGLHSASGTFERTDSAHDLPDTAASGTLPLIPWGDPSHSPPLLHLLFVPTLGKHINLCT